MNIYDDFNPDDKLDFHEYKIRYDFEVIRILEIYLEDSYLQKFKKVLVVTGKGDVIRPAVKKVLEDSSYVKSFKMAGYYNGQDGAYEVMLRS